MHRLIPRVLCILLIAGLTSCQENRNGTTGNSGPVSHAPAEADGATSGKTTNKNSDLLKKLKGTSRGSEQAGRLARPLLVDRASELGVRFNLFRDAVPERFYFPEVMGSGIAWLDFDLDGFWDLYLGNGDSLIGKSSHRNQVFRNLSGKRFDSVSELVSPDSNGFTQGLAVGDVNQDGFDDLFVSNYGKDYLLINQGDGSFDRQDIGGLGHGSVWGASAILVDLDSDGDVDLFQTCYVDWTVENHHPCVYQGVPGYCGPGTYGGTPDLVYINQGDGQWTESHSALGIDYQSKGLVVCAADFDDDRRPEIYVGSDLTNNAFYRWSPDEKKYQNVANDIGLAASKNGLAEATMGFAVRDFDGNGHIDLFLTHYFQNKNTLYLNQGDLFFRDASYESRIKALSFDFIGFGTIPLDYDGDSDFDLFISNGHVLGENIRPFRLRPQLLNNDNKRFFDVSEQLGGYFGGKYAGRAVAGCDFDNDGDVDIAVGHLDAPYALLENRTRTENRFLTLQLLDPARRDLTGTTIDIESGGRRIRLPVVKGESYLSSMDPRLNVGLGKQKTARITVHWSFGKDQVFENVASGKSWLLTCQGDIQELGQHGIGKPGLDAK